MGHSRQDEGPPQPPADVNPQRALNDLLLALFTAEEFRRWLKLDLEANVEAELPGEAATAAELMDKAVSALERRGLIVDRFFRELATARPKRDADVERVRRMWLNWRSRADGPSRSGRLAFWAGFLVLTALVTFVVEFLVPQLPSLVIALGIVCIVLALDFLHRRRVTEGAASGGLGAYLVHEGWGMKSLISTSVAGTVILGATLANRAREDQEPERVETSNQAPAGGSTRSSGPTAPKRKLLAKPQRETGAMVSAVPSTPSSAEAGRATPVIKPSALERPTAEYNAGSVELERMSGSFKCGARTFQFFESRSFSQIFNSADSHSQQQISFILQFAATLGVVLPDSETFNIFTDRISGATFAVPANLDVKLEPGNGDCLAVDAQGRFVIRITGEDTNAINAEPQSNAFVRRGLLPYELVAGRNRDFSMPMPASRARDGMTFDRAAFFINNSVTPYLVPAALVVSHNMRNGTYLGVSLRSFLSMDPHAWLSALLAVYMSGFAPSVDNGLDVGSRDLGNRAEPPPEQ